MKILLPENATAGPEGLDEYRGRGGYEALQKAFRRNPQELVQAVIDSGLQGRGGAAFSAGRKWQLTFEQRVKTRYLVVNGGEDEPGSYKDRCLMQNHPHLVLEGAAIAALAIGARQTFLYVNETFPAARQSMSAAIEEFLDSGILNGRDFSFGIFDAPEAYVAGEDTAALEVLEGKPPIPRKKPPYPVESGYHGFPTLIHNVETLANVPFIVREGPRVYRTVGTAESPGTMLFYLNDEFKNPGIYELPFGTPLRRLVEELGGGLRRSQNVKAILPGGPSTAFLPSGRMDIQLEHNALRNAGSALGCGNVRLIPLEECMVEVSLDIAQFFARESCGKCPQCRMETNAFVTVLQKIVEGEANLAALSQLENVADFSRGRGDCNLIHMAAAPVLSAARHFRADFESHIQEKKCGGEQCHITRS